jgi:hypothetical protein
MGTFDAPHLLHSIADIRGEQSLSGEPLTVDSD